MNFAEAQLSQGFRQKISLSTKSMCEMMLHPPPGEGVPGGMDLCSMFGNDGGAIANLLASVSSDGGGPSIMCSAEELTAICEGTYQDPPCGEALDRITASMPQDQESPMDMKSMICMIAPMNASMAAEQLAMARETFLIETCTEDALPVMCGQEGPDSPMAPPGMCDAMFGAMTSPNPEDPSAVPLSDTQACNLLCLGPGISSLCSDADKDRVCPGACAALPEPQTCLELLTALSAGERSVCPESEDDFPSMAEGLQPLCDVSNLPAACESLAESLAA